MVVGDGSSIGAGQSDSWICWYFLSPYQYYPMYLYIQFPFRFVSFRSRFVSQITVSHLRVKLSQGIQWTRFVKVSVHRLCHVWFVFFHQRLQSVWGLFYLDLMMFTVHPWTASQLFDWFWLLENLTLECGRTFLKTFAIKKLGLEVSFVCHRFVSLLNYARTKHMQMWITLLASFT